MTADDITRRIEVAAEEASNKRTREHDIDRLSRMFKKRDAHEIMMVLCSYQAMLIIDMAGPDAVKAREVWQASWAMSTEMMRAFYDVQTDKPQ